MEVIDGLDVVILKGGAQDVQQMIDFLHFIEQFSGVTEPVIDIVTVKHVDCTQMATLATNLYNEVYLPRQGSVSITPLVMPNAILIVGRAENVKSVKDLITRLDQPAFPGTQFHVFHLQHTDVASAYTTIQAAFPGPVPAD